MNKFAIIYLSTGSFLLAVCAVLTVIYRAFHVRINDPWAYTGIACVIVGITVFVVGLKYAKERK